MIFLERLVVLLFILGLIYWTFTSKRLDAWIKRRFGPKLESPAAIKDVVKQVELDRKAASNLVKEKQKQLSTETTQINSIKL